MKYYYVVIDKLNKTLQLKECNTCLARLEEEIKEQYNLKTRRDVDCRFSFFFNGTENKINFDTIYKYAKKYQILI